MKIGIVSKPEHCQAHVEALSQDGWELLELASSPTSIPPTVDLVILRTASCAHRGSDTAFAWARETGKPLIVENGLSGIRRELKKFQEQNGKYLENKWREALSTLQALRPADHPEAHRKALLAMGAAPTLLDNILMRGAPKEFKGPDTPQLWQKGVKLSSLYAAREEAVGMISKMEDNTKEALRRAYLEKKWPERWRGRTLTELAGKPLVFAVFLIDILDSTEALVRQDILDFYFDYSGRKLDMRVCDAAAWLLGKTVINRSEMALLKLTTESVVTESVVPETVVLEPVAQESVTSVPASSEPVAPEGTVTVTYTPPPDPITEEFRKIREEFDTHVLELMETIQKQTHTIQALQQQSSLLEESLRVTLEKVANLEAHLVMPASPLVSASPIVPGANDLEATLATLDVLRKRGANIVITLDKL